MNMRKTKELLIDFGRKAKPVPQLTLNGEVVERVSSYEYLGTTIDSGLTFNNNTQTIFKKCLQWYLDIAPPILRSFYLCYTESLLTFFFLAWYEGSQRLTSQAAEGDHLGVQALRGAVLNPLAGL